MREMKALLIYLTSATCLVFGILAAGSWALGEYHSHLPIEPEAQTTAIASTPEFAAQATNADNPSRQPVWIEPTKKYIYNPLQVMSVRPDPAPPVTTRKPNGRAAPKPVRSRGTIDGEARRAYGAVGQGQQLLILPLQHQAPN